VKAVARVALVLVTAAVLEQGLLSVARIDGVAADVLLLVAVSAGIVGGPDLGALVGFFAGLTLDLLLPAPLGLAALAYCLSGYAVGALHGTSVRTSRWQGPALAAAGSALGIVAYVLVARVVGRTGLWNTHLFTVVLVVALVNAVLAPLAIRLMGWALGDVVPSRPAIR
jgi:rod shape-determining protein MreD